MIRFLLRMNLRNEQIKQKIPNTENVSENTILNISKFAFFLGN